MVYVVSVRLPSLLNVRMHWTKMMRLKQEQRGAVRKCLERADVPRLPMIVTITRVGPRTLDEDNLQGACKYVRDEVASIVGTDDGSPLYTWIYRQRVGRYKVEIEFLPRTRAIDIPPDLNRHPFLTN